MIDLSAIYTYLSSFIPPAKPEPAKAIGLFRTHLLPLQNDPGGFAYELLHAQTADPSSDIDRNHVYGIKIHPKGCWAHIPLWSYNTPAVNAARNMAEFLQDWETSHPGYASIADDLQANDETLRTLAANLTSDYEIPPHYEDLLAVTEYEKPIPADATEFEINVPALAI